MEAEDGDIAVGAGTNFDIEVEPPMACEVSSIILMAILLA